MYWIAMINMNQKADNKIIEEQITHWKHKTPLIYYQLCSYLNQMNRYVIKAEFNVSSLIDN